MNNYMLGDLISDYYESDFLNAEEAPLPVFSSSHNKKMKKAFKIFKDNRNPVKYRKTLSIKRRLLIAALIIVCLAFMTGGVIVFISNGFRGRVYTDNTHLFAVNTSGCPTTIEEEYRLSVVPDGYELCEAIKNPFMVYHLYENSNGDVLLFDQTVKSEFNTHINTEGYDLEETAINGYNALRIDFNGGYSMVICDNGDYVFEIYANLPKNGIIKLIESVECEVKT